MFTFTISPDGAEPYELVTGSRDVVVWEKAGRNRSFSQMAEAMRFTDLYELAHIAAKRQGKPGGDLPLAIWEETRDLDLKDDNEDQEDGDSDPTQTEA